MKIQIDNKFGMYTIQNGYEYRLYARSKRIHRLKVNPKTGRGWQAGVITQYETQEESISKFYNIAGIEIDI